MPGHVGVSLVLGWVRALAYAAVAVLVGRAIDDGASGRPYAADLVWAAAAGTVAWLASGALEVHKGRAQAAEELRWRRDTMAAVLGDDQPVAGTVVSEITGGVEQVSFYRATFLGPALVAATTPFGILAVISLTVQPRIGLVLAGLTLLVPVVLGVFMMFFRKPNTEYRRASGRLAGLYLESLKGLTTLSMLGAALRRAAVVRKASGDLRRHVMGMLARNQLVLIVIDLVFGLVMVVTSIGMGLAGHEAGVISTGAFISLVVLTVLLLEPIDYVGAFFYVGMGGIAMQKRLVDLAKRAHPIPAAVATSPSVDLELRDVHVTLTDRDILTGIDLRIPAGTRTALVGASGAGKTTIARLLDGLLVPTSGEVLLDGRPATVAELRSHATLLTQFPYLVTGTVADNLRIADPGVGEVEMWDALERAHVAAEVREMGGLSAPVGEGGSLVSGGQASRLALARALIRDSPVLVLDEPTAHLDVDTEALIADTVDHLDPARTVIAITHRTALTENATLLVNVVDGGIAHLRGGPGEPPADTTTDKEADR